MNDSAQYFLKFRVLKYTLISQILLFCAFFVTMISLIQHCGL